MHWKCPDSSLRGDFALRRMNEFAGAKRKRAPSRAPVVPKPRPAYFLAVKIAVR